MIAADIMVTNVITVRPDTSVRKVAEILLARRISALPVVDDADTLLGIISEADLLHRVEVGTERPYSWWVEFLTGREGLAQDYIKAHGRLAADIMTRKVFTVTADTSLREIVNLFEKHNIKRVPVVAKRKLVGIVSRADVVQALLRAQQAAQPAEAPVSQDTAVARLRSEPWWPGNVNVVIDNGAVELWGIVESQVQKDAIRVALETIPGVRTISNKIHVQANIPRAL
jgi:CBS-domain-containing membrane protein